MEHLRPTPATVKELYGTAFRCGKPDCQKPLYRTDSETGNYILNSHVAHIHARSENGPRWNAHMSEADNRTGGNLIPLCLDHAYEVDNVSDVVFTADLLRSWKVAQIAEYDSLQRNWTINDDEAAEVIGESFYGHASVVVSVGATAVVDVARQVNALIAVASRRRESLADFALAWRDWRAQSTMQIRAYDPESGERLLVEPPRIETRKWEERLVQMLTEADADIVERTVALAGELGAVAAAHDDLRPWCDWVRLAVTDVKAAAGRWPAPGHSEDDGFFVEAIAELLNASSSLVNQWHKRPAESPPEPFTSALPGPRQPTAKEREAFEHKQRLDAARPWARASNRDWDPVVYQLLVEAAEYASGLPGIMSVINVDLSATANLAASVARKADDATLERLVDEAAQFPHLATSVIFLQRLSIVSAESNRASIAARALEVQRERLRLERWNTPAVWRDNRFHALGMLHHSAALEGEESVRALVASALQDTELLQEILRGLATWRELRDVDDWSTVTGIRCGITSLPSWVPLEALADRIENFMPGIDTREDDEDTDGDDIELLAGQALQLARLAMRAHGS